MARRTACMEELRQTPLSAMVRRTACMELRRQVRLSAMARHSSSMDLQQIGLLGMDRRISSMDLRQVRVSSPHPLPFTMRRGASPRPSTKDHGQGGRRRPLVPTALDVGGRSSPILLHSSKLCSVGGWLGNRMDVGHAKREEGQHLSWSPCRCRTGGGNVKVHNL